MIDVETGNDFLCGHHFEPKKCPYRQCGYRTALETQQQLIGAAREAEVRLGEVVPISDYRRAIAERDSSRQEHLAATAHSMKAMELAMGLYEEIFKAITKSHKKGNNAIRKRKR